MSLAAKGARVLGAFLPGERVRSIRSAWHHLQRLHERFSGRKRRFERLNRGLPPDSILLRPGLQLAIDPRARESFEWFCFRSPEMVAELDTFLAWSGRAHRFLDVGACHGIFSLAFARSQPHGTALAVEPSPLAFEILQSNIDRNGAAITAVRSAVGAENGKVEMRFSWHHLEVCAEEPDGATVLSVPMRTLDDLCAERGFWPDLVKIDVEGYELPVLRGARRLLSETHPTLLLEIHPTRLQALGSSTAELFDLLAELGYGALTLGGVPLKLRAISSWESTRRVLCTPKTLR